jgi:rhodanese-related sulfurtransferase
MKALINLSETKNLGIIVLGILLSLPGCTPSSKKVEAENKLSEETTVILPENRKLSPAQAYEMIAADAGVVVLDVRTTEEFENGHIAEAVNIDFLAEDFKDHVQKLDKEKTYLVYCMGGKRSNQAQLLMDSLAFKQVYDLMGGFRQWSASDLPHQ